MSDGIAYVGDEGVTSGLDVQFYKRPDDDGEMKDFVRVRITSDPHTVIDTEVTDDHKAKYRQHWQAYQQGSVEDGTPIEDWGEIQGSMLDDFKRLGFRFVEQVASSPDASFVHIMGGIQWRNRANAWLMGKNKDNGDKVSAQEARIAELEAKIASMLEAQSASKAAPARRGRKPKAENVEE
jgi:hypothetical protein